MLDMHKRPEELLKGRRTLSPKEYREWVAAVHRLPPEEVIYDPDTDIIWCKPKINFDYPATGSPDQFPDTYPAWKPKRKPVKTIRHPLKSFADLAVLTRAWRRPKYENLRYVYVKDGLIVEHESVTDRAPNAQSPAGDPGEAVKHIKQRIAALGADRLFLVHNHHFGYSAPSAADGKLAALLSKAPQLKGLIITDSSWFCLITVQGIAIFRELPDKPIFLRDPVTGFALPDEVAREYEFSKIVAWTKAFTKKRKPVPIFLSTEATLYDLQTIGLGNIDKLSHCLFTIEIDGAEDMDPSVLKEKEMARELVRSLLRHGAFIYLQWH